MRHLLSRALALCGMEMRESGTLAPGEKVTTVAEAQTRADALRAGLLRREVHDEVLRFCRAELLVDDHFHAVLEAVKGLAARLRNLGGIDADGAQLVDGVLGGTSPLVRINPLLTASQRGEQAGFANLLKGLFGMFRNPTAHEARVLWPMSRLDAEDTLSIVSLAHRRFDGVSGP